MGVLYALMQHDLKRLLAYHTVENIGIIFIGLGLALAFKAHGMDFAAALALTAALLHVFNHSLFKSLLFFGAGAVLTATGERDMEHLGGLIHRMPQTAFVFLVGCVAISALPPLNGFVSEWLTFQAILLSPQLPSWGLKLLVPAVGALLALSAALAAACFVKAFGMTFLGRPRTRAAEAATETDRFSLAAMYPSRRALPARRRPARPVHRCAGAGQSMPGRRATCRCRPARNGSRSCRSPRAAAPMTACSCSCSWSYPARSRRSRSTASPPTGCAARRHGTAAIPMPSPATQYTADELRPADPPRVRHPRVPRPRACRHAAARRHASGAARRRAARSDLGLRSMRRSRSASALPPIGSIVCSS